MWIVYDWSDGLIGTYEKYEEAEKEYQYYAKYSKDHHDGEISGDERVVLAKVERQIFTYDTGKVVYEEDENGEEYPTTNTYWDYSEEIY